ncbi:hypothetical protein Bbelb_273370 [Branchiostoma belcheri]|nr:hypothetical protein Bbelb_273370 [Branchiostoma belcheri]
MVQASASHSQRSYGLQHPSCPERIYGLPGTAAIGMKIALSIFLITTFSTWIPDSAAQKTAVALKASLLSNYDKSLLPVKSASTAVNVDFDISLRQIIELYWEDEYLTWNASEHDGVDTLTIHSADIWRPDIFLYNNIAETYGAIEPITDVTVTSDGRVSYLQPAIFTSACPVGIERFPFDKQECELEFGSWMYASSKLNLSLVNPYADRRVFTKNEEWILKGVPMERRQVALYPCCPEPFTTAVLTVQLERRSFFYMFNMVLPCIILMVLNVLGFYIPPDSGERLGFFMTILLALVVFLQVLASSLPKTSTTVPQLGQFFAATIGLVGFSCLASIVVIRLEISRHIREFSHRASEKKAEEEDQDEWKMAALVLDRALMFAVGLSAFIASDGDFQPSTSPHPGHHSDMRVTLSFFVFVTFSSWIPDSLGQEAAIALKSSLLSNYDKSLRPVKSASTAVNVDFDFSLRQIIDLAEKEQTFRLNVWLRLYWDDEFLTWNASEHDGVEYLTIHSSDVWRPDIFLYNNIAETYGVVPTITDVTVTSAGRVTYLQPAIFTSSCPVQIEKFPFDKQECELEFGSWIYTGSHLNLSLVNPYADRAVFTKNEEWILNAVPMERRVAIYPCCPEPYVSIIVKLQLERRSYFYMFNMVLPCIVLMILNVFGFYIPPDSGERLGFSMTILLALVVFLQVLSDSLPKTSTTTPQLGQFFAATIGLVGFSCLASIVEKQAVHPAKGLEGVDNPAILIDDDEAFEQKNSATLELDLSLREISRYMRGFAHSVHEKKAEEEDQDEWKMVALVLDRALMFAGGWQWSDNVTPGQRRAVRMLPGDFTALTWNGISDVRQSFCQLLVTTFGVFDYC